MVYEPAVIDAFKDLGATSKDEFKRLVLDKLKTKLPPGASVNTFTGWEWVLIIGAVAAGISTVLAASVPVILAIGVVMFLALLGIAIIYAIHEGYDIENLQFGVTDGWPHITFSLKKVR